MRKLILLEENKKKILKEAWESIDSLKAKLPTDVVAMMNASVQGKKGDDWSSSNKWTDASEYCPSIESHKALIEIFIEEAYTNWHCTLEQLDPGKDVLIEIIYQLGFKESENPYFNFMETFFTKNSGFVLSENNWNVLYDLYANQIIEASDLTGNGRDKDSHIIFNGFLFKEERISKDSYMIVDAYEKLSDNSFAKSLNLDAIKNIKTQGKPKSFAELNTSMTPIQIRNTIVFKEPSNLSGDINSYYYIKEAINVGLSSTDYLSGYLSNKKGEVVGEYSTVMYNDKEMTQKIEPKSDVQYKNILDGKMYTWSTVQVADPNNSNKNIQITAFVPSSQDTISSTNNKYVDSLYKGLKNSSVQDRINIIKALIDNGLIDKDSIKGLL